MLHPIPSVQANHWVRKSERLVGGPPSRGSGSDAGHHFRRADRKSLGRNKKGLLEVMAELKSRDLPMTDLLEVGLQIARSERR
jgi:hypothetical protein